jgi:23S rRNA pseudouridine1911/1915/1917 synthase
MQFPSLIEIPEDVTPSRADRLLAELVPGDCSRSALAKLIRQGRVRVKGKSIRPSTILNPGDQVEFLPGEPKSAPVPDAELLPLTILFEDVDVIVLDKPPGLVVHPGAGRQTNTLMDLLIKTRPEVIGVGEPGRWGVVHRLDRDTSGVMVAAKTVLAHASLSTQFREHSIHRVYLALVRGNPGEDHGRIDAGLGRHTKDRKRISTSTAKARRAVTEWRVQQRFDDLALLQVFPETGRTHQIRVHLASVGLPVLGDQMYGRTRKQSTTTDPVLRKSLQILKRQALHAAVLGFVHPRSSQKMEFSSPMPSDMAEVVKLAAAAKTRHDGNTD